MASLLLGPMHRYADDRHVSVWVETDEPCTVEVRSSPGFNAGLGSGPEAEAGPPPGPRAAAPTFAVAGHHYALVVVDGLEPGTVYPYEVWLTPASGPSTDPTGEPSADPAVCVWPEPGSPPSLLRPVGGGRPVRLVFGSCRVTAPQERPYTLSPGEDPRGLGTDALHALALRLTETPPHTWPDALLLLGDQVYADHVSPTTAARIRTRRDITVPPGEEIADFTEYAWLYQEAWSQREIRWLLSTVPTAMIADDHDIRDDWNISAAWRAEIRSQPWWDTRITSGIMAYWLYQHLGNLDPGTLAADPVFTAVTATAAGGEDGENLLRAFARRVDRMPDLGALASDHDEDDGGAGTGTGQGTGTLAGERPPTPPRWSYRWDLGRTRLIVIDSRFARVVAPDGTRAMVHDADWSWVRDQTRHTGEVDHLLLGTSVPYLLTPTIHNVEAVSERLASGRFGRIASAGAERLRQALDLEHWAAFSDSFVRMTQLLHQVSTGEHGPAPASVVVLSGDVHHAYLARAEPARDPVAATRLPADLGAGTHLTTTGDTGTHRTGTGGDRSGSGGDDTAQSGGTDGESAVWQAVCSPFRNPLGPGIRRIDALSRRRPLATTAGRIARLLGTRGQPVRWKTTHGPWFDSQLATLVLDGRGATMLLEKTEPDGDPGGLDEVMRATLS
ncbi:DUF7800 domain-containing protein [Parafrankia discariae]|uniref:DUF7800 domain-containing protein n=1 Tax=Parafrankia discariae TaxID=365528 RepID=UPI000363E7B6|nr:alkaline phosphatase D family protein [Parafrankia discariae]